MPTLVAATVSRSARTLTFASASASATKPPVTEAVRVPPSASSTSQSIEIVARPELVHGHRGAQRAADEALDLLRAPARRLAASVAVLPARVGARVHLVLGRDPTLLLSLEKRRDLVVDRRRAEHDRPAGAVEHRPLGGAVEAERSSRRGGEHRARVHRSGAWVAS